MRALLHRIKGIIKAHIYLLTYRKKKFNIGSANIDVGKEWFSSDIGVLNIAKKQDWQRLLGGTRLDNIMAEHVWEHLNQADTQTGTKNCFYYLKTGGRLRLAVPDGFNIDKDYIEYVKPGGYGPGADDHKILYNYQSMKQMLENIGFEVELLEYWDENGQFHFTDWTDEGGHINRSKRYDERNQSGELRYTSLIVDAIKN